VAAVAVLFVGCGSDPVDAAVEMPTVEASTPTPEPTPEPTPTPEPLPPATLVSVELPTPTVVVPLRDRLDAHGQALLADAGLDAGEWVPWSTLIDFESGWDPSAQNPTSTAFGLGQFLDSTWWAVGCVKSADPFVQLDCMFAYIVERYGSPSAALAHWYAAVPIFDASCNCWVDVGSWY